MFRGVDRYVYERVRDSSPDGMGYQGAEKGVAAWPKLPRPSSTLPQLPNWESAEGSVIEGEADGCLLARILDGDGAWWCDPRVAETFH